VGDTALDQALNEGAYALALDILFLPPNGRRGMRLWPCCFRPEPGSTP
jgi:hypothetical protein